MQELIDDQHEEIGVLTDKIWRCTQHIERIEFEMSEPLVARV